MNVFPKTEHKFDIKKILKAKHVAIPGEHGAWIFLLSPLAIGLFIGGFSNGSIPLVFTILTAFIIRQPIMILVKIRSGRRKKRDLPAAIFWLLWYSIIFIISLSFLLFQGNYFILFLAAPAIPVFLWHLWLVSKREERRQKLIEIAAGGVLALAAPAAFWVGRGDYDSTGWTLWLLSWLQVTGTILYAYLRLQQRQLPQRPSFKQSFRIARETFLFNLFIFIIVVILAILRLVPPLVPIAFVIQPTEVLWGVRYPAIKVSPKRIGVRQLIISILFTMLFILFWLIG